MFYTFYLLSDRDKFLSKFGHWVSNICNIVFIAVYVSYYLHLRKYIDSNQLCYISLASYPSPENLLPRSLHLVS